MKKLTLRISFIQQIVALISILLLSPLFILLALISFLDTRKNPIFIQERGLTLEKYRFKLLKFRTIKNNGNLTVASNDSGILKKPHFYSATSTIGKFLRKTGLDELPQLFNVLFNQMNFFGPRPLMIEDLKEIKEKFPELYLRRNQLKSKPGILGLWQVYKDFECSIEHLIRLDEEYEKKKSLIINFKILSKTLEIVFLGYHIDSIVNGKKMTVYPFFVYVTVIAVILLLFFFLNNL